MLDFMSDVTRILSAVAQGDPEAASRLLPLVYAELRQLAAQKLAHEPSGQTLQPTALVHEAYLRLVASPGHDIGHPLELREGDVIRLGDQLLVLLSSPNGAAHTEPGQSPRSPC